ncbi:MAG: dihydropteroate synthase [Gammaproteobacteria bacterium]|nr:dihydropteroate synthase [Gammaproteobacteria bacterium]NND54156.1 dihydropteroate synthase [Gammaproteobacteria bacterium]
MQLQFPDSVLDLSTTRVMGVLNVTPDSFSDGGLYTAHEAAVEHALTMLDEGADIIDIGGESTRPGAQPVSAAQELDRIIGVIEALRKETGAPLSVDTSKAEVMAAALTAGASMLNDVRALREPGALAAAAQSGAPVCLMHMQGEPRTMQSNPGYADVVTDVAGFLLERAVACEAEGVAAGQIVLDPGFGFGKSLEHNIALLTRLELLLDTGYPILVGMSRKSMIPAIMASAGIAAAPDTAAQSAALKARDRLGGSVTLALYAAGKGAHIVRVHDVRETVEALTIQAALETAGAEKE